MDAFYATRNGYLNKMRCVKQPAAGGKGKVGKSGTKKVAKTGKYTKIGIAVSAQQQKPLLFLCFAITVYMQH